MACRSSGAPHASQRRLGDTPWPRVPQKFTSMPRARAAAAFVSAALSALAASFAYATWMWLALCRAIIWSREMP